MLRMSSILHAAHQFNVKGTTNVNKLAGAIFHSLNKPAPCGVSHVDMSCVGHMAISRGVKALCLVRKFMAPHYQGVLAFARQQRVSTPNGVPRMGVCIEARITNTLEGVVQREDEKIHLVAATTAPRML
eukprot:Hpha_TRINITY_DN2914_c0_g2::TRINITY_DN2914_c0_g2_i1::g.19718::m.19718